MLKGAAPSIVLSTKQQKIIDFIEFLLENKESFFASDTPLPAKAQQVARDAIVFCSQPLSEKDIQAIAKGLNRPLNEILPTLAEFARTHSLPPKHPHQAPPLYPHAKALILVELGIALTTFYQSPGTFTSYAMSTLLAKILSPMTNQSQLLSNLALIGCELATDYGPFTIANAQMASLLKQYGAYTYLIPVVSVLIWKKTPALFNAIAESDVINAAQDFSDLMYGTADEATYEQYQDYWMTQDLGTLSTRIIESVSNGLRWMFGKNTTSTSEIKRSEPQPASKSEVKQARVVKLEKPSSELHWMSRTTPSAAMVAKQSALTAVPEKKAPQKKHWMSQF